MSVVPLTLKNISKVDRWLPLNLRASRNKEKNLFKTKLNLFKIENFLILLIKKFSKNVDISCKKRFNFEKL